MLKVDLDDVELDRAGFLKKGQVTMPVFSRMLEASVPRVWGPREGLCEKGSGRQSSRPNEGGRPRRDDPGLSSEQTRRRLQGEWPGQNSGNTQGHP